MKVLYKDYEGALAVMEVTKASYIEEEKILEICGPEEDIAVIMDQDAAENAVRKLYAEGKADLTAYKSKERDLDDDFDDDDDDEDEDDFLDRMLDMDFKNIGKKGLFFGDDKE